MRRNGWILMAALTLVAVIVGVSIAGTTAVTPNKFSPAKGVTEYFDQMTFTDGDTVSATDTLRWASDRNFTDTTFDCAVFLTNMTATGILRAKIVNDSVITVVSSAADSAKTYCYRVVLKKL